MGSAYDKWQLDAGGSDDEEELADEYRQTKEAIYWCIEATPTMLAPVLDQPGGAASANRALPTPTPTLTAPAGSARPAATQAIVWQGPPAKSKLEECLRCIYAMMKRKVISSPKDLIGILVWNTADTVRSITDNCHLLFELKQIDAGMIKKLREILQRAEKDPDYLPNLFKPRENDTVIGSVFANAMTAFREASPNANNCIFWVTDNDDPVSGNTQLTDVMRRKRMDVDESGFGVETFFVPSTPGDDFDLDKFYGEVMTVQQDDEADEMVNAPIVSHDLRAALESMVAAMRTKETAKRVAFKIPFVLGKDLSIGITGYNMIGEEVRKPAVKVDLNTSGGDEIVSKVVYKDSETGTELDPKRDIKKYFQVGKDDFESGAKATKIFFTEADVRKVKTLGRPPSLKLLGFKPRKDHLRFQETVKHSYFIYPDEERYSGSTRTFAALLKSMLKKEVVGFASFLPRTNARPQVVLLLPQEEKLSETGVALIPGGIHLCQLPFADDLRELGLSSTLSVVHRPDPETDDEPEQPEIDAAKKIVKNMSKVYHPDIYPNPALNYFYDTLAAVALDEDIPEPEDNTKPAYELMEQRIGKFVRNLRSMIRQDEIDPTQVVTSNKKRVIKKEQTPADAAAAEEFLADFRKRGDKLKLDELKRGLRLLELPLSGRKAELVDRIQAYVARQAEQGASGTAKMEVDEEEDSSSKPQKKKARHVLTIEDDED
ncbi:ATP-dependent DNA helicase 2 subunit 1 [Rhodotorula taiwanensis]|uniref:ATP-dependent DNA helicase II subunit 1 n=1 Tax=Rhodotorula taiwanensis TaxID=741276 RepID=A0A2S5B2I9_9BASI|nr:ATP-dependent DNA helicase 2 subunit 1 [Rhodotorula taiwanensis]